MILKACIRFLSMIVLVIFVMSAVGIDSAYADSIDEWNRSCRKKTKGSTPVYAPNDFDLSSSPVCTLPSGTYVKVISGGSDISVIEYMTSSGVNGSGFVRSSNIVSACVQYTDENGDRRSMNELEYYDKYGKNQPSSNSTSGNSGTSKTTGKTNSEKTATQKTTKVEETSLVVTWNNQIVTVKVLGVKDSIIEVENEEWIIATTELVFSAEAEADKGVAVIHAPNTGKCSLRKKASQNAGVIIKCKAGTVVYVLQYGEQFCKISYNGTTGYVLTSCLKFYSAEPEVIGSGVLTYNGKATGRTTINVRNSADSDSAKIAEWKTGTEVQVFALHDGWYEVEYNGVHGYVMQKFITMAE